jgi:hypothetical protein
MAARSRPDKQASHGLAVAGTQRQSGCFTRAHSRLEHKQKARHTSLQAWVPQLPWAAAPELALPEALPPPPPPPPGTEAPAGAAAAAAACRSCLPPLRAALQAGLCSFQWAFWQAALRRVGVGSGVGGL